MLNKVTEVSFVAAFITALLVACCAVNAHAMTCNRTKACNQVIYDAIYKKVLQDALAHDLRTISDEEYEQVLRIRNTTIETLRQLCNGQKSSYETGKGVSK